MEGEWVRWARRWHLEIEQGAMACGRVHDGPVECFMGMYHHSQPMQDEACRACYDIARWPRTRKEIMADAK